MKKNTHPLVISYQMGKVASSSICESIKGCIQTHSWSHEEPIKFFSSRYTGSLKGKIIQNLKWKIHHYITKQKLEKHTKHNQPVKILIGVREPVSRNISGYFQTLTSREKSTSLEQHIHRFYAFCPHLAATYWFDNELLEKFNIDVYQYPFNKELGFSKIKQGNIEIFIYKFEKLGNLEIELKKFLNLEDLKLTRTNDAEEKWLNNIYREFKKNLRPSKEYLDLLYSTKYSKHFYTDSEISDLIKKWS